MRVTIWELRQLLLWEALLLSEVNVTRLATKGAKNSGVVIDLHDSYLGENGQTVLVVSKTGQVKGAAELYKITVTKKPVWKMHTLWADAPTTAMTVLAASLERFKAIVPDETVSPAAQAMIKRYFDENKDDPTKVAKDAAPEHHDGPDFLRAAYLGPVGFDLTSALQAGDDIILSMIDKSQSDLEDEDAVVRTLLNQGRYGFNKSYASPKKTGFGNWAVTLRKDFTTFVEKAMATYEDGDENDVEELSRFVKAHVNDIDAAATKYKKNSSEYLIGDPFGYEIRSIKRMAGVKAP